MPKQTSREVIKRCIEFRGPERVGLDFNAPQPSDILQVGWGRGRVRITEEQDPTIRQEAPDFSGKLFRDEYGTIWGQLTERYGGEVVKGVLQDGWEKLDGYKMPDYNDPATEHEVVDRFAAQPDKYHVGILPGFPFAIMRYMRRMDHFLLDVAAEPAQVLRLNEMVVEMLLGMIDRYGAMHADAVMFGEDWGTQDRLLISPRSWRELFKPSFRVLVDRTHKLGMHIIMHSCGYIYEIVPDLIEVGIDVLQLDQPTLMGIERVSREFGGHVCFYSPVDIQKIMQTGDKAQIQQAARDMIRLLGGFKGGLIAKDYPQWDAIDVKEEWAQWARDVFIQEGIY